MSRGQRLQERQSQWRSLWRGGVRATVAACKPQGLDGRAVVLGAAMKPAVAQRRRGSRNGACRSDRARARGLRAGGG